MTSYLPSGISTVRSDAFDRQVDRLFHEALRAFAGTAQTRVPASNAWEHDNGFSVQMALPGWEPKDITLEVNNQVLTVKGARNGELQNSATFHLREMADGPFTRLFQLPAFVEHNKASAIHKHGLLTITFPKREEAKRRHILIDET